MRGLKALLKVKHVAEDQARKALSSARHDYDTLRAEQIAIVERAQAAKDAVRELEQGPFGIRDALMYRRYLNALRGRMGRSSVKARKAKDVVDSKAKAYEEARHRREAVGDVIATRQAEAKKVAVYREERETSDLAQQKWTRDR